jgi:hypothetical protein
VVNGPSSRGSSASIELARNVAIGRHAQREEDDRAMLRKLPPESLAWLVAHTIAIATYTHTHTVLCLCLTVLLCNRVQLMNHDSDPRKGSRPYYWSAITGTRYCRSFFPFHLTHHALSSYP